MLKNQAGLTLDRHTTHTCVCRLRTRRVDLLRVIDEALPLVNGSRDQRTACENDPFIRTNLTSPYHLYLHSV